MSEGDVRADVGVSSARQIRFSTIKRNPLRVLNGAAALVGHIGRFPPVHAAFRHWRAERGAIAPRIDEAQRSCLVNQGMIPEDLNDLIKGL